MARPSAADRIADLTAELEHQRTRADAAEAELRDARNVIATMEDIDRIRDTNADHMDDANSIMRERVRHAERDVWAVRLGLSRLGGTDSAEIARLHGLTVNAINILAGKTVVAE